MSKLGCHEERTRHLRNNNKQYSSMGEKYDN